MTNHPLRRLPPVHELAAHPLLAGHAHELVVAAARAELEAIRQTDDPASVDLSTLPERILHRLNRVAQPQLRSVINATGIVLHTNLGRSPMARAAVAAATQAAAGYLNLELDLHTGKRASRQNPIRDVLIPLLGCESATVVNNCAAATVITLRALALGREVIVSRGQLIEIGGSFRIPEIMQVSGATLREVGTTNITRARDYQNAIGPQTALLMRIHPSNYRISGYTEEPSLEELVALGRRHQIPVIDDVGSGALIDLSPWGLTSEPLVPHSLKLGADLVLFSGDKLLGGPQSGIICGRKELIDRIETDPLMRAFRLDKMTLAALEATLLLYRDSAQVMRSIPTLAMIALTPTELRPRCEAFRHALIAEGTLSAEVESSTGYVGGGSLPDQAFPTIVISLKSNHWSEGDLAVRLRQTHPAVLTRVQGGRVLLDLRTVFPDQEKELLAAVLQASRPESA